MGDKEEHDDVMTGLPLTDEVSLRAELRDKVLRIEELEAELKEERERLAAERKRAADAEAKLTLRELMALRAQQERESQGAIAGMGFLRPRRDSDSGVRSGAAASLNSFDKAVMDGLAGGGAGGAVFLSPETRGWTTPPSRGSQGTSSSTGAVNHLTGLLDRGACRSRSGSPPSRRMSDVDEEADGCWYTAGQRGSVRPKQANPQAVASMELPKNNPYVGTFHRAGRPVVRRARKISASNLQDWLVSAELKITGLRSTKNNIDIKAKFMKLPHLSDWLPKENTNTASPLMSLLSNTVSTDETCLDVIIIDSIHDEGRQ